MTNRIALLRREKGIKQQELADKLGITRAAVAQYESGKTETIKEDRLMRMSELFKASPAYIMGWSDMREEPSSESMKLVEEYDSLNELGKNQLKLRLWELSQISYYTDAIINPEGEEDYLAPIAAHADGATKEVLLAEVERIKRLIGYGDK
jgi:transcriptional regulator with XRE-family HTH domain